MKPIHRLAIVFVLAITIIAILLFAGTWAKAQLDRPAVWEQPGPVATPR